MSRRHTRRLLAASLPVLLLATACVGPARSEADYRADVANAAKTGASAVSSAMLTAQAVAAEKAAAPYTARRLTEDEQVLQSTITAFGSVQPPSPELDALRAEVVAALEEASAAVGRLRLAAFRANPAGVVDAAADLPGLADRLRGYQAAERQ